MIRRQKISCSHNVVSMRNVCVLLLSRICRNSGASSALATKLLFLDVEVPDRSQQADRKCAPIAFG
jgi:hypothetical protein